MGEDKRSALHELGMGLRPTGKMIEIAIKKGADVHQGDRWNNTPLHLAAHICQYVKPQDTIKKMKILLKHGAKINAKNVNGHTTLHFAAMRGKTEVLLA